MAVIPPQGQTTSRPLCIGISGGNGRSSILAVNRDTAEVSPPFYAEPLNLHRTPPEVAHFHLEGLCTQLAGELGYRDYHELLDQVAMTVVAMPGCESEQQQQQVYKKLLSFTFSAPSRVRVVDDTWAGLFAETREAKGICAFAGYGASVLVAQSSDHNVPPFDPSTWGYNAKVDGWGPIIGDLGSRFHLVTAFFQSLSRLSLPLRDPTTQVLLDGVTHYLAEREPRVPRFSSLDEVQDWFTRLRKHFHQVEHKWWRAYSDLAQPIVELAESPKQPNPAARQLVSIVATEMAKSAKAAQFRLFNRQEFAEIPIILQGRMFRESALYTDVFRQSLQRDALMAPLAKHPPVVGCLMLACWETPALVEQLYDLPAAYAYCTYLPRLPHTP